MANIQDLWVRKDKTRTALYGKGKRWVVNWTEPDGGLQRESFPTKDAAKAKLTSIEAELQSGTYVSKASGVMTVREWSVIWFDAQIHQREGSLGSVRRRLDRHILPSLGDIELRDLTRVDIQAAVTSWSDDLSASTVRTAYVYLAGMLKHAVMDKHLRASPAVKIKLPQLDAAPIRPIAVPLVQELTDTIWPSYRAAVVFAAASGLRPSELFGLTWDRIDMSKGLVVVDRQLVAARGAATVKFGPLKTPASYRSVRIGAATLAMLETLDQDAVDGIVFHRRGKPVHRQARSKAWRVAREKLPGVGDGWHQLRHHHASLLIAAGLSPVAVAHRLGHKDATETLKTYSHLWPNDDERMVSASDGLIRLPESGNTSTTHEAETGQ